MSEKCNNCKPGWDSAGRPVIQLCPKHAAVDKLLAVIHKWAIPSVVYLSIFDDKYADKALENIHAVIAAAEPKP